MLCFARIDEAKIEPFFLARQQLHLNRPYFGVLFQVRICAKPLKQFKEKENRKRRKTTAAARTEKTKNKKTGKMFAVS